MRLAAGCTLLAGVLLSGCSEPTSASDIPGTYFGSFGDGERYRLVMSEDLQYRVCREADTECARAIDRGRYATARSGYKSVIEFSQFCMIFETTCENYDAYAQQNLPGPVEITFVDEAGETHVFRKVD